MLDQEQINLYSLNALIELKENSYNFQVASQIESLNMKANIDAIVQTSDFLNMNGDLSIKILEANTATLFQSFFTGLNNKIVDSLNTNITGDINLNPTTRLISMHSSKLER